MEKRIKLIYKTIVALISFLVFYVILYWYFIASNKNKLFNHNVSIPVTLIMISLIFLLSLYLLYINWISIKKLQIYNSFDKNKYIYNEIVMKKLLYSICVITIIILIIMPLMKTIYYKDLMFTVSFDLNGMEVNEPIPSQQITRSEKLYYPIPQTKEEYYFSGWILDDEIYDFSSDISKDITLKASYYLLPHTIYDISGIEIQFCFIEINSWTSTVKSNSSSDVKAFYFTPLVTGDFIVKSNTIAGIHEIQIIDYGINTLSLYKDFASNLKEIEISINLVAGKEYLITFNNIKETATIGNYSEVSILIEGNNIPIDGGKIS